MGREIGRKEPIIICRCNDVTLEDIEKAIDEGYRDIESLRRRLRIGMGPCQGRTCIPLLIRILARKLGVKPSEIKYPSIRPPIVPIQASLFLKSREVISSSES